MSVKLLFKLRHKFNEKLASLSANYEYFQFLQYLLPLTAFYIYKDFSLKDHYGKGYKSADFIL